MTEQVLETPLQLSASDGANTIAYKQQLGTSPTIIFLHGFRSDMSGAKGESLARLCAAHNLSFLRFDLRGHGQSSGHYTDFTLGDWLADTLQVIDSCTTGPLVLVSSSLGGWLMLRAAALRPERVKAMVSVAPAPDFPTELILPHLSAAQRAAYETHNEIVDEGSGTRYTRAFIEESARHNCLHQPPAFNGPVRFLQGMKDMLIPWQQTTALAARLGPTTDVRVTLFKEGDHPLNETAQLEELGRQVLQLTLGVNA